MRSRLTIAAVGFNTKQDTHTHRIVNSGHFKNYDCLAGVLSMSGWRSHRQTDRHTERRVTILP